MAANLDVLDNDSPRVLAIPGWPCKCHDVTATSSSLNSCMPDGT